MSTLHRTLFIFCAGKESKDTFSWCVVWLLLFCVVSLLGVDIMWLLLSVLAHKHTHIDHTHTYTQKQRRQGGDNSVRGVSHLGRCLSDIRPVLFLTTDWSLRYVNDGGVKQTNTYTHTHTCNPLPKRFLHYFTSLPICTHTHTHHHNTAPPLTTNNHEQDHPCVF